MNKKKLNMPKQTAPVVRNLNTTAQAGEQNGVEASINWSSVLEIGRQVATGIAGAL